MGPFISPRWVELADEAVRLLRELAADARTTRILLEDERERHDAAADGRPTRRLEPSDRGGSDLLRQCADFAQLDAAISVLTAARDLVPPAFVVPLRSYVDERLRRGGRVQDAPRGHDRRAP